MGAEIGKAAGRSDLLVKIATAAAALYFALLFRVGSGETDSNEGSADVGRDCHKLNKCGTCAGSRCPIKRCIEAWSTERGQGT